MERKNIISKSAFLIYRQCPKYLWHQVNDRENIPEPDLRARFNFKASHFTASLAKKCFPEGIEVNQEKEKRQSNINTLKLMNLRKPLFGADILYKNACFFSGRPYDIHARSDILLPAESGLAGFGDRLAEHKYLQNDTFLSGTSCLPVGHLAGDINALKETAVPDLDSDAWDIIEVKITTGIKKINIYEIAFQKFCYKAAGINIRNCYVMNINTDYMLRGEIDPFELFKITEITPNIEKLNLDIEKDLQNIAEIISGEYPPKVNPGKFCTKPFNCPLKKECWESVSSENILFLYSINHKMIKRLNESDIGSISDIPLNFYGISEKQKLQIEHTKNNTRHIDKGAIADFLKQVSYPVFYLDFETFASPIPLIENTRPYQSIPFQFSLHVSRKQNEPLEHYFFLSDGRSDPRPQLLLNLKNWFGFARNHKSFKGTVIVYDESFERSIFRDLVLFDTEHINWIFKVADRIVDLYYPFKNFYYYNLLQRGSASVKKILPALTDKSYDEMAISNGDMAAVSFLIGSHLWKETTSGISRADYNEKSEEGSYFENNRAGSGYDKNLLKNTYRNTAGYSLQNSSEKANKTSVAYTKKTAVKNTRQNTGENEIAGRNEEAVRLNLLEYCKLDTEGLYYIMRELERLVI